MDPKLPEFLIDLAIDVQRINEALLEFFPGCQCLLLPKDIATLRAVLSQHPSAPDRTLQDVFDERAANRWERNREKRSER